MTLVSIGAALAVWTVFSWPLPRYAAEGIPSSAHNVEKNNVRRMLAGDHLQLHYFYWLFSDMLTGGTPWWHNLYEFNTGNDEERRQVGNYNMPLSFVYAAGRAIGGPAFGWNFTIVATIWGSLAALWALLGRYTHERRASLLLAVLGIALPYRWIAVLGGSPTGFAMLWPPLLFLGLDQAGRDDDLKGGLWASLALAMSFWNDPHTFFFSALCVPVGYMAGFLRRDRPPWPLSRQTVARLLRGVLPVAATVVALGAWGMVVKSATFAGTTMEPGRQIGEVLLFTPRLRGLFGWQANHTDVQIFVGYVLPLFFVMHALAIPLVWRRLSQPRRFQRGALVLLLYGSVVGVALLATGPLGPFQGLFFRAARKLLPGYEMIRQPGKIFAVMPPLLALATAVAALDLARLWRRPALKAAFFALPVLLACVEFRGVIDPTVCLLDMEQPAYEAVARDADEDDDIAHAHALILPLWPGDSHWASLYQHYVSLYRIRMVNGYSPIVSHDYKDKVYNRFYTGNAGLLDDAQLDQLRAMGVYYIVFHEDAFPERISAYPVVLTLRRLVNHPRLTLLRQGGSIWAFSIRAQPESRPDLLPDGPYFPALRWNAGACLIEDGTLVADESAWGGSYVRAQAGASATIPHPFKHMYAPQPKVWVRARGEGALRFDRVEHDPDPVTHQIKAPDWIWVAVPLPTEDETMRFRVTTTAGTVDVDMMLQAAGPWRPPDFGESVSLPGCLFFRSGYTDPLRHSVSFRPGYDAASRVFYGLRLPLKHAGKYAVELVFTSDAPDGTRLGEFTMSDGHSVSQPVEVVAGRPAALVWARPDNRPLDFDFTYTRNGSITIHEVELTLMNEP